MIIRVIDAQVSEIGIDKIFDPRSRIDPVSIILIIEKYSPHTRLVMSQDFGLLCHIKSGSFGILEKDYGCRVFETEIDNSIEIESLLVTMMS